ncbi:glycosyltransferase [Prevotella copri]|jgi:glycosyltransferase involved in cell wall biosynthesis|uniref:Glycosyltransferase n=1 Tax=Segatella copri TaxID=165179 RepID=A0AAW4YK11_9BACT|nr:glycosyltransferase family 2 protein [Segatella copri]MCE4121576.1 glycosyltransferase [Segatella copri]MCP9497943.1 glycosyltransferase [Segatella copri]MCP9512882.1 glycosyltransferase [Segatella copri]MCP9521865.1 glycosyltransferase [Segatella copri]
MVKVSVIVPIYNVEKYIEDCAKSLFQQTLNDIEYIFVNDCTPDNSIKILKEVLDAYPERKNQVKIVNLEVNSGQAAARKRGVSEATGDFIIFCDGDDWVDKNMYQRLYDCAIQHNYDFVRCLFSRVSEGHQALCKLIPPESYANKKQLLSYLIRSSDFSSTCDKLVRRNVVFSQQFVYPKDNMCEDLVYVLQYVLNAKSIGYINESFYYYRQNESSISHVLETEHICRKALQISNNVELLQTILAKSNLKANFVGEIVAAKYMAKDSFRPIIERNGIYEKWKSCFSEINSKILFNKYLSVKQKLNFVLCLLGLYPFVKRLYRR